MNERTIQLYKQAVDFAYTTAGEDAGKGTIIESLTAGKFAELIVRECVQLCQECIDDGCVEAQEPMEKIKQHFGVEE
jgi:hypothetical protein